MKPRKDDETDAQYIARLEAAYDAKSRVNDGYKRLWRRVHDVASALQQATLVVEGAAEITGTKDDSDVAHSIDTLRRMSGFVWDEASGDVLFPRLGPWPKADREKFGGDVDMILNSAIEKVKQSRPPWESWDDVTPAFKGKKPEDLNWTKIANEVFYALSDLEIARGILRLDLRSAMYDHCFERLQNAIRGAELRTGRAAPGSPLEHDIPF